MATTAPPSEVLSAFLGLLNHTVQSWEQELVPMVRGSFLMRHWLGDEARPAVNLDLECFEGPRRERTRDEDEEDDEEFEREEGRYGEYGEYESLVDYGKAMCRYAANQSAPQSAVEFQPSEPPAGGVSLWTYGTPGERYFAGWTCYTTTETGLLQIDIAESSYAFADIATTMIEVELDGQTVECPAYTPETLLAAKLSWLLRSLHRTDGTDAIEWKGEPKDLFDAFTLLTRLKLTAEPFQKSFLAIGTQDQLDWNNLVVLLAAGHALKDADFPNWAKFHEAHKGIVECGPAEMLRDIAEKLAPLLGDFYSADEMPFILAANANTNDEMPLLVHADWLDDHDRPALAQFVREYAKYEFHHAELEADRQAETRAALKAGFDAAPRPWLYQFFGSAAAANHLRGLLDAPIGA